MSPPPSRSRSQQVADLLDAPVDGLEFLDQLSDEEGEHLCGLLGAAITERRHVIAKAMQDAQRFLPGPLRRRLAGRFPEA